MAVVTRGGKHAVTHYKVEKMFGDIAALIECRLETGRTHQIRVHMASIGHSVVGDPLYGGRRRGKIINSAIREILTNQKNQVLHAYCLGFKHPKTGEKCLWKVENPTYFNDLVEMFETI